MHPRVGGREVQGGWVVLFVALHRLRVRLRLLVEGKLTRWVDDGSSSDARDLCAQVGSLGAREGREGVHGRGEAAGEILADELADVDLLGRHILKQRELARCRRRDIVAECVEPHSGLLRRHRADHRRRLVRLGGCLGLDDDVVGLGAHDLAEEAHSLQAVRLLQIQHGQVDAVRLLLAKPDARPREHGHLGGQIGEAERRRRVGRVKLVQCLGRLVPRFGRHRRGAAEL
mmetsp:Transcript_23447/g.59845  ORF Transcript_23447/g.59845 Transcript_23447/m.59845 type:complete len:230 (+) Transcript_23447:931-1620(+)